MHRLLDRSGMSLMASLVALGILSITMAALISFFKASNQGSKTARIKATQNAILNQASSLAANPDRYIQILARSPVGSDFVLQCLNTTAAPACPATAADLSDFPEVSNASNGRHVIELAMVSSSGQIIAGTNAAPTYWSESGGNCLNPTQCDLETRGFAIMNTATNPDSLQFMIVARANPRQASASTTTPLAARSLSVDLGTQWKDDPILAATIRTYAQQTNLNNVASGRLLSSTITDSAQTNTAVSNSGQTIKEAKQNALECPAGEFMRGITLEGKPSCTALPAAACSSANEGQMFYDKTASSVKFCDGNSWTVVNLKEPDCIKAYRPSNYANQCCSKSLRCISHANHTLYMTYHPSGFVNCHAYNQVYYEASPICN